MTRQTTPNRKLTGGRALVLIVVSVVALVLATLAGASASSSVEATEETQAQLPPAPLVIEADHGPAEPGDDIWVRPIPGDCPQGMIFHEGQCIEFVPPSDECPPGTIEYEDECVEFEVPDCDPGFVLEGLECVPLQLDAEPDPEPTPVVPPVVDAPQTPQDDCPPGTIYHEGQCIEFVPPSDECPPGTIEYEDECVEFEVPDCDPGFVLEGLECVPLQLDAEPIPEPTPVDPVVPVGPPVIEAPERPDLSEDDCPPGTIFHEGQCIEFVPPTDECPPGTIEHEGQCIEFLPPTNEVPSDRPAPVDCPQGTIFHEGQCIEFVPPTDECPPGTIEHDGQCVEFEVPDCGPGYKLVGLECVKLTFIATPVQP